MDEDAKSVSRRNLLRALTIAGGAAATRALPERWTRPVVDSVEIPVHAQSSGTFTLAFTTPTASTVISPGATQQPFVVATTPPTPGVSVTVSSPEAALIQVDVVQGIIPSVTGITNGSGTYSGRFHALQAVPTLRQKGVGPTQAVHLVATANGGAISATVTFSLTLLPV
ncbi:MAG TPA: twin-arginine translocation signal domain-containing protein [Vicinamibacterales bacterium]|jgi:hypothetical protein